MQRNHPLASSHHRRFQRKALAIAVSGSLALAFAGGAYAQAVNGTIHGTVPVASNEAIQITGGAGYNRTIAVGQTGRYALTLPVGTYTVSLLQDGKVIQSRSGVSPVAAGAVTVNFTSSVKNATTLNAITVSASALPPIDVTTTNQVTTITAQQLQQLPLGRSAAAIALLAPGVGLGSPKLAGGPLGGQINVFGGASTAENAYYIDGMNTTDALGGQGGIGLPYGAIAQQQTFTSGYGAKYGRSIGGVINQIGKSGSNQWHFGVRAQWEPASWHSTHRNYHWNNPRWTQVPGQRPGDMEDYNQTNESQQTVYDAYVSGPIIKDKLFFFLAAEQDHASRTDVGRYEDPFVFHTRSHHPKYYVKLNWNINESNFLTVTGVQSADRSWGSAYDFDYNTLKQGAFSSLDQTFKTLFRMLVANYTGYLTDNLTVHAMFGKMRGEYYNNQPAYPGFDPTLPYIGSANLQNPLYAPVGGIRSSQTNMTLSDPAHRISTTNYRVSIDYQWHNHDFQIGIDNINTWNIDDGYKTSGPGYAWIYGRADLNKPIEGTNPNIAPYVGPPNANPAGVAGYYVAKWISQEIATVRVAQRAQYVEDTWQVTPRFLLNLGLRNDQFVNYNTAGQPYIRLTKPQWAPRIGFSWDVHGDATLKVFGNAGRYYLALPSAVGTDISSPTLKTSLYGTYKGIDPATGEPIDFVALPQNPATGVSIGNQYGGASDPRTVAAQNIRAEYSDNYALGLQQQFHMLGTQWVFGAAVTLQRMGRIIDDYDNIQAECAAGRRQGYAWMTPEDCGTWATSLLMVNPGSTSHILMPGPDGKLHPVTLTGKDQGFPRDPKRKYYSLDLSLSHVWDGKWFAKFDYVFSRNYGNDEGPVETQTGASGSSYVSHTTAWDFPQLMEWSNGLLPNNRKHQFKVYGAYAINDEFTVGGDLRVVSGTPKICEGYYGPDETDPLGYGSDYHWCGGHPAPIGSMGTMPWIRTLNLNLDYKPRWADHKLDFNLAVFNVFNAQTALWRDSIYGTTENPNDDYDEIKASVAPRTVRFAVSYNF